MTPGTGPYFEGVTVRITFGDGGVVSVEARDVQVARITFDGAAVRAFVEAARKFSSRRLRGLPPHDRRRAVRIDLPRVRMPAGTLRWHVDPRGRSLVALGRSRGIAVRGR